MVFLFLGFCHYFSTCAWWPSPGSKDDGTLMIPVLLTGASTYRQ